MTDRELIEGCLRNDRLCQEKLFKKYSPLVKAICWRYLTQREDVNDVLQESFIKVFKNLDRFNFDGSFEGWVKRTVINTVFTKITRYNFNEEVELIPEMHESYDYREIIDAISVKELRQEIAALPTGYRLVFNMHVIEGYNHREIGEILKITEGTSRSQLIKARKMLQMRLLKKENKFIEHEQR